MDCRDLDKYIWAVAEHNVPPEMNAAVEGHLARCDDCRLLSAELTALHQEAQKVNVIQASPYFYARLKRRIEAYDAARVETERRPLPRYISWKSVAVAAVLIVGVAAGVRLGDAVTARRSTSLPHIASEEFLFLAALDGVPHGSLAETLLEQGAEEEELR